MVGWLIQGKGTSAIAAILHASRRTVEKHLERAYAKLGVRSRGAAVRRALDFLGSVDGQG